MKNKAAITAPILALTVYLLFAASVYIDPGNLGTDSGKYFSVIVIQLVVFMLPAVFYCRIKGVGYSEKMNLKLFSPTAVGIIILSLLLMVSGSVIIRFIQIDFFGVGEFSFSEYKAMVDSVSTDGAEDTVYRSVAFALVPAIAEEFLFRSVILCGYCNEGYTLKIALLISSVLSSLYCFSLEKLPILLYIGVILGLLTLLTHSVFPAVMVRFVYNLYWVFGEGYIILTIKKSENAVFFIFAVTVVFLLVLIFSLGEAERILYKNASLSLETPDYVLERNKKAGKLPVLFNMKMTLQALLSPTFLVCIAVFAAAAASGVLKT